MTNDCTLEERLIARMAREFDGESIGVGATILGDLAARLAKALYAPDLFLTTASRAAADPDVHAKSLSDEWVLCATARMSLDWEQMFQLIAQGRLQIWVGAVQIDQYGASNISVVGDWNRPTVQLIGARGVPDDLWGCEHICYHLRTQTRRSLVAAVDFECAFGNRGERTRVGRKAARPGLVVTDLGVYDFNTRDGRMQIVSLHPGVDFNTAQERCGFELERPSSGEILVTPDPTEAELRCIREIIDPRGLRRLESRQASEAMTLELWREDLPKSV